MKSLTCLPFFAAGAFATGILLPLYVYPSAVYNDGAANWQPVRNAISANPSVDWQIVINPGDGPGHGDPDVNYISGTEQFNDMNNVRTIGYVHTQYGASPISDVEANITQWATWNSYASGNISIHGIFFDEADGPLEYLSDATQFAKNAFPSGTSIVTICNFGAEPAAEYYGVCDEIIVFEDAAANYDDQTTINQRIPDTTYVKQAAIVVHDFAGTTDGQTASVSVLDSFVNTLQSNGVGWGYFCSGGYSSVTTGPATIGALASALG